MEEEDISKAASEVVAVAMAADTSRVRINPNLAALVQRILTTDCRWLRRRSSRRQLAPRWRWIRRCPTGWRLRTR